MDSFKEKTIGGKVLPRAAGKLESRLCRKFGLFRVSTSTNCIADIRRRRAQSIGTSFRSGAAVALHFSSFLPFFPGPVAKF